MPNSLLRTEGANSSGTAPLSASQDCIAPSSSPLSFTTGLDKLSLKVDRRESDPSTDVLALTDTRSAPFGGCNWEVVRQ